MILEEEYSCREDNKCRNAYQDRFPFFHSPNKTPICGRDQEHGSILLLHPFEELCLKRVSVSWNPNASELSFLYFVEDERPDGVSFAVQFEIHLDAPVRFLF